MVNPIGIPFDAPQETRATKHDMREAAYQIKGENIANIASLPFNHVNKLPMSLKSAEFRNKKNWN